MKYSGTDATDTGRSFQMPLLQFGADVELSPSMIAGLSLGFGDISSKSVGFTIEGTSKLIQPYLGWD